MEKIIGLEERLKYWHFRCLNCDNKLGTSLKEKNEIIDKKVECEDCKTTIHIMLNKKFNKPLILIENSIIINCIFNCGDKII